MYLWDPVERRHTCCRRITPSAPSEALDPRSAENLLLSQMPAKIPVTTDAIELSQLLQADNSLPDDIPDGQIPDDELPVSLEGISSAADDPLLPWHENDRSPLANGLFRRRKIHRNNIVVSIFRGIFDFNFS